MRYSEFFFESGSWEQKRQSSVTFLSPPTQKKSMSLLLFSVLILNVLELVTSSIRLPVLHQSQLSSVIRETMLGDPLPIDGNYARDGEFYLNLTIGDQPFSLLIDTGSSDLGLAAVGCNGCTKKYHKYYDPSSSAVPLGCEFCEHNSTGETDMSCKDRGGKKKQCTYRVSYADDSGFSAALYEDDVIFSSELKVRAAVGAMYNAKFPNPKSVDGIIGFADLDEASSGATTPYLELVESGLIEDVFSLCLTTDGGVMYLGEESFLSDRDVVWTARVRDSGFYTITIDDVKIGGTSIGVSSTFWFYSLTHSLTYSLTHKISQARFTTTETPLWTAVRAIRASPTQPSKRSSLTSNRCARQRA